MEPTTITIIITAIVSLITALGGKELVKYLIAYYKSKNTYKRSKNQSLEDYLTQNIKSLQIKLDSQAIHIDELMKENTSLRVEVGILNEKLSQYYAKFGIGSRGNKK